MNASRKPRGEAGSDVPVLERVIDGFVAFDTDMNYTYVNESGAALLGRTPVELIGKNYWAEYPEARGTVFANAYIQALETQNAITLEDYYAPFDRWFENRIYPSEDGLSVFFTDVTERKRAEFLLAEERNILEMIAQGDPLPKVLEEITLRVEKQRTDMLCTILLVDSDGIHMRHGAAPSMSETFIKGIDGQPMGPAAGSCGTAAYRGEPVYVSDIAVDPLWADYRELALQEGLRASWSTPIMSTQGKVLGTFAMYYREPRSPGDYDIRLIALATHLAGIGIERDQREAYLRETQERLALAVRSADIGLWDWDLRTDRVVYSAEWKSLLGYAEDEIRDDFSEWERRLHPDDRPKAIEVVRRTLDERRATYRNQFRMRHKNGSYRWIMAQGSLFEDESGEPTRLIGSHVDITEHMETQRELERHRENLEELVVERTAALEEANAAKTEFLGRVSHELRTPLNSIIGFSRLLLTGASGEMNDAQRHQLELIEAGGVHLLSLIGDILDLAKIEARRVEVEPSEADLCHVLTESVDLLLPLAERKKLELGIECEPRCLHAYTDHRLLTQVVINLVGNAVKFTNEGSVMVSLSVDGDLAKVAVRDTGPGIPAEEQESIFTDFGRGRRDRERDTEGTGLGLAISLRIAKLLGGSISLESTVGEGSTFILAIPIRLPVGENESDANPG